MSTTFYLETSALVKRYALEAGTAWVRALCDQPDQVIAVALFGLAEVAAAVNGKRRGGAIDQAARDAILADLKADTASQYLLLDVDQFVVDEAIELTGRYRLRGYDAIHLACALRLNRALIGRRLPPLMLVSADADLLRAAQTEGLGTEDPNLHL
jgi:predicted nucleic acid-binding protein